MRQIWAIVATAFLSVSVFSAVAAEPKRVLLVQSFGRDFLPFNDFSDRFREQLTRQLGEPIEIFETSLAIIRSGDPQQESAFVDYVSALFAGRQLDLVVTLGAPSARLLQRHRARLFPSTPLLITAADQRVILESAVTANDTVVAVKFDFPEYVKNILQLLPKTTTMAVVAGTSQLENFWHEEMRREFQPFANRLNIIWFNDLSFDEILKSVAALPPQSVVFYGLFSVDANGVSHEQGRALTRIHGTANAPIFSYIDSYLGRGIVGGPLISNIELSQRAAGVAVRLVRGESPGEIKTPPLGLATPVFDARELQRWAISEDRLPPGSTMQFHEPTEWEKLLWPIFFVGVTLALLAVSVLELLFERHRRQRAEVLARDRMSELAHLDRVAVAGQLSASIAHEISQPLAAMVTNANAGLRWLSKGPPNLDEARAAFDSIISDGHRSGDVIRTIREMFKRGAQESALVDVNNLIIEVLAVARGEVQKQGVLVRTELAERLPQVLGNPIQLQQVMLNLIMNGIEAMNSIMDRPRTLRLKSTIHEPDGVLITVEDSGTGIDPQYTERIFDALFTTKSRGMGMGLSICRSIIEAHHGRLWASPGIPQGSIFHVVLPTNGSGAE
jgi:signal transduction histidine kinase